MTAVVTRAKDPTGAAAMLSQTAAQLKSDGANFPAGMSQNEEVPGLGDQANAFRETGAAATTFGLSGVEFRKGSTVVAISVSTTGRAGPALPVVVAEARAMLGRLD